MDALTALSGTTPAPALPSALGAKTAAARHQAAEDFEAVFLAQMMQPMFNTVEVDETFGGGHAEETWRGIMVEEIAKQTVKAGGIGLASSVEKEMLKLQEAQEAHHGAQ